MKTKKAVKKNTNKKEKPKKLPKAKRVEELIPEEKPKAKTHEEIVEHQKHVDRMEGIFSKMKYADLQRECLMRGMTKEELVSGDLGRLQSWLIRNWDLPQLKSRIDDFDKWREKFLKERGMPGEPFVRLGYLGEINPETKDFIIIQPEPLKKVIIKRKKDEETGLFKGTKKSLTFQCVKEGLSIDETIKKVISKFPEAKDKSIKIWAKNAKKLI
jgi:hypothetical protein